MVEVYNKTEAAKKLTISVETVNKAMRDGKLPFHKYGQRVMFTEADLLAFLEACAVRREPAA